MFLRRFNVSCKSIASKHPSQTPPVISLLFPRFRMYTCALALKLKWYQLSPAPKLELSFSLICSYVSNTFQCGRKEDVFSTAFGSISSLHSSRPLSLFSLPRFPPPCRGCVINKCCLFPCFVEPEARTGSVRLTPNPSCAFQDAPLSRLSSRCVCRRARLCALFLSRSFQHSFLVSILASERMCPPKQSHDSVCLLGILGQYALFSCRTLSSQPPSRLRCTSCVQFGCRVMTPGSHFSFSPLCVFSLSCFSPSFPRQCRRGRLETAFWEFGPALLVFLEMYYFTLSMSFSSPVPILRHLPIQKIDVEMCVSLTVHEAFLGNVGRSLDSSSHFFYTCFLLSSCPGNIMEKPGLFLACDFRKWKVGVFGSYGLAGRISDELPFCRALLPVFSWCCDLSP